jgi:hypothetical protein
VTHKASKTSEKEMRDERAWIFEVMEIMDSTQRDSTLHFAHIYIQLRASSLREPINSLSLVNYFICEILPLSYYDRSSLAFPSAVKSAASIARSSTSSGVRAPVLHNPPIDAEALPASQIWCNLVSFLSMSELSPLRNSSTLWYVPILFNK